MSTVLEHGDVEPVTYAEPFMLSRKGRRFLQLYIRLYQVAHGSEVNKASLLQLRGCGERTATEILNWLNIMAMQRLSLLSIDTCLPETQEL